jgi:FixJ family two-component response regulator
MPRERCVHIVDDEAKVRNALTLLLSTAQIESRCYTAWPTACVWHLAPKRCDCETESDDQ